MSAVVTDKLVDALIREYGNRGARYVLDGIPPSNNKYAGRENSWEYRSDKNHWETYVAMVTMNKRPRQPLKSAIVILTYHFPTKGRRDPDNNAGKFILDGLRLGGVLADDSFDCITLLLRKGEVSKKPTTEILVLSTEEEVPMGA